jgi:hypothetical protein
MEVALGWPRSRVFAEPCPQLALNRSRHANLKGEDEMWDAGAHATCFRRLFNRTAYLGAGEKFRADCRELLELCGAPNAMPQWLRQGGYFVRSKSNSL